MNQKLTVYILFLIIGTLSVISLTSLHDPILHGSIAILNGWDVVGWDKGILTGWTNVSVPTEQFDNTPIVNVWLFYMLPALLLFFGSFVAVLIYPNRFIAIIAMLLMFLNFASLSPERLLSKSDSSQAVSFLISRGVDPLLANVLHWSIFILAILALITTFYIMFENDQKDSEKRAEVIK